MPLGLFWEFVDIPALHSQLSISAMNSVFLTTSTKQKFKDIQCFYFNIYTIWKFGSSTKDYGILKQRPALQSLREEHFCQLALQVVTKQNLFLKYFHPFNSNFFCESANDSFLKGGGAEVK